MKIERGYAQHLGSRQEQQDAGLMLSEEARGEQLLVVADGMGGHAGGSIASSQLAETARQLWAEHTKSPLDAKRLLERIIREGHEAINKAGAEKGLGPRSTCAMLLIQNGIAHWAHVGDSRIYRLRGGQVTRLTRDHSVVQMLVDLGKVAEEEMGTHPDQNRLTQSLGGDAIPLPDFGNDAIQAHDAFLVCSDGLWEMIPQAEMAAALAAKKLGDDGAQHLVERAFDRAKPKSDNITVALLRVGGPPPAGAAGADADEAETIQLPDAARAWRASRSSGGGMRWGFAAATVVALGGAAAVVYKPWEPGKTGTDTQPAAVPKGPTETPKLPKETDPPKTPEAERKPGPDAQPAPRPTQPGTPPGGQQGTPSGTPPGTQPSTPPATPPGTQQNTPPGTPPGAQQGTPPSTPPSPPPGGQSNRDAPDKPGRGSWLER